MEVIHFAGGDSQNRSLPQYTADACVRPALARPVEPTVLGNVILQTVVHRIFVSIEQARARARVVRRLLPFSPSPSLLRNPLPGALM